jgi:ribose transport system permease protein
MQCPVQWVKLITFAISGGAIWRTVIGVLFIALIGNGFTLLAWNPLYEQITLGVILLLAVGGDAWSRLRTT